MLSIGLCDQIDNFYTKYSFMFDESGFNLSNGHSPQICQNGELLVRMCRGESHFSQKLAKASVGESGEYHKWPHFGKCESGESVTAFWRIW
jgi:hypothetical protein